MLSMMFLALVDILSGGKCCFTYSWSTGHCTTAPAPAPASHLASKTICSAIGETTFPMSTKVRLPIPERYEIHRKSDMIPLKAWYSH